VDYTVEFAGVLHARSPNAKFSFLSGNGADQTGRSRIAFARYKGQAEKVLLEMGFPRVCTFRPAYIYPVAQRREPNSNYRLLRGDFGEAERSFRKEAERHSGIIPNTIGDI
jgi:hypothetical protein